MSDAKKYIKKKKQKSKQKNYLYKNKNIFNVHWFCLSFY